MARQLYVENKKDSPHSISTEAEEEKLKMWKEMRQQMHEERELAKMQLKNLELLEAQTSKTATKTRKRGTPKTMEEPSQAEYKEWTLPSNKEEQTTYPCSPTVNSSLIISRKKSSEKNTIQNLDLNEASTTEDQAENHQLL
jgi:hypothetical protein